MFWQRRRYWARCLLNAKSVGRLWPLGARRMGPPFLHQKGPRVRLFNLRWRTNWMPARAAPEWASQWAAINGRLGSLLGPPSTSCPPFHSAQSSLCAPSPPPRPRLGEADISFGARPVFGIGANIDKNSARPNERPATTNCISLGSFFAFGVFSAPTTKPANKRHLLLLPDSSV
jgi:hypothetical protein